MIDAALVCHQLGLVLNPDDWFLERSQIPQAGTTEQIILRYTYYSGGGVLVCYREKVTSVKISK
jgi:hypothetical protein